MTDEPVTASCGLYLLTPPRIDLAAFLPRFEAAFEGGPVAAVQLRLKDATDAEVLAAAERLMPIAHAHDAAFIVNDRPDLAKLAGADGVHLGEDDMDVASAREILGYDKDIGISCYASKDRAFEAGDAGADYVAFGAFFPTETKDPKARAVPDILTDWTMISELPCVAIGGITADNCGVLVEAGADLLAVSSYVWTLPDGPASAVHLLTHAIEAASE
ncbi:thiamine-phosphate pyrophosphorylase [Rhodothalassium salexigens DSM 2132]|uniref:Thiamine-phosphate synthase n=1 Tax=Rhodothalassium salexigens DSM 2132 TaxID=1188247 RepID=A0A4R2PSM0_RHOSA|nr:thiamine phosphate synthase [Rhodothalassium salexigens]MBB4210485.1 thiamine-phosphate pyrophosphorylase [Rhodothalassium salexigens DSM 2132]MBK1639447.1 thiamine phosphate synthase [Rhodothalassium salexigens DSM 2132]TCP37958.1 thiamine-phosphate pyrophosphorylase [Rhodothalassium salexigens DSM 2132]